MKLLFLKYSLALLCLLPGVREIYAQTLVPFTSNRWVFPENKQNPTAKEYLFEEYLDQPSLRLGYGSVVLKDAHFTNGIIEYDAAFTPERGGVGLEFRMQDEANTEHFYIRTHQSGNPDATQYIPIFNDSDSWQLYHGDGYSAAVSFPFNQWVHFKVVVSGRQMEVFINDMDKPALFVPELKRPIQSGMLALFGRYAHFANFKYNLLDKPLIKSTAPPATPMPTGTITSWQVSSAFAEKNLDQGVQLTETQKKDLSWQTLPVEQTGIVNLATGPKLTEKTNTTFAKLVLISDKAQIKKLQFGFSDRAKVYLNDQIIYSGHDEFRSRDYRFLGTVGYFDELYLSLKPGRNELWIAVSEDFGGWGIKALLADQTGLKIQYPAK